MKSPIFWAIMHCIPLKVYRRFGETYFIHLHVGLLLDLFFEPKDGGDISLQMLVDFQRTTRRYIAEDRTVQVYSVSQTIDLSCRVDDTANRRMHFV